MKVSSNLNEIKSSNLIFASAGLGLSILCLRLAFFHQNLQLLLGY